MKLEQLKVKQRVYDRWWYWKVGRVTKVLKTRVHVEFDNGVAVYDRAHCQFLERA